MSTKIYDAVKIPTTDMAELIRLARRVQPMEMWNLTHHSAGWLKLRMGDNLKALFEKLNPSETGVLARPIRRFARNSTVNPTIICDEDDKAILLAGLNKCAADAGTGVVLAPGDIEPLVDMITRVAQCRVLTFYPTSYGFSLLKWYTLTREVEKFLREEYDEFEYQNSTDGPPLEELDPEMYETMADMAKEELKDLERGDPAIYEAVELAQKRMMYNVAHAVYRKRMKVWDEVFDDAYSFSEVGLSFDLFNGVGNQADGICYEAVVMATLPEGMSSVNVDIMAAETLEWEKDKAWMERFRAQQEERKRANEV